MGHFQPFSTLLNSDSGNTNKPYVEQCLLNTDYLLFSKYVI